jgi:hypothetical protein
MKNYEKILTNYYKWRWSNIFNDKDDISKRTIAKTTKTDKTCSCGYIELRYTLLERISILYAKSIIFTRKIIAKIIAKLIV